MRHGETSYNLAGRVQGGTDIPLNENGIKEANMAREFFIKNEIRFDKVISSPLKRAAKTASIVSGKPLEMIETDERVRELNFGTAEGEAVVDLPQGVLALFSHPQDYEVPAGGETIAQLQERTGSFIADAGRLLAERPDIENLLVVSHGAALRGFISVIEKTPVREFWVDNLENCCTVDAVYENGRFHVERYLHPLGGTKYMIPPWRRAKAADGSFTFARSERD